MNDNGRMTSRLLSFVIWAAVAASAAFWGLRLTVRPAQLPPHAVLATQPLPQGGDLTRLFGAPPPPVQAAAPEPVVDNRFKLLGVVAPAAGQHRGLALIAVDGKTARAIAIGERVEGDMVLRSITHRRVELSNGNGGPVVALELPPLAEAARGTLPVAVGEGGAAPTPTPTPTIPVIPAPPMATQQPGALRAPGMQPLRPAVPVPSFNPTVPQPGVPVQSAPPPAPFGVTPVAPLQPPNDLPASR